MFNIIPDKGFQITFANGNTVSVMFGEGNYCANQRAYDCPIESSSDAEVLAWDKNGKDLCQAQGWQTPEEVAAFIAKYSV